MNHIKTASWFLVVTLFFAPSLMAAKESESIQLAQEYRALVMKVRPASQFQVTLPFGESKKISYQLGWGEPKAELPNVYVMKVGDKTYREFSDRIFLSDDSFLNAGGEKIPLTCVYVEGRDLRPLKGSDPKIADFILKVTLVARDYTCTGPLNPAFPNSASKPELWDTFLQFEVRDPTLMMPLESKLRYGWNEFFATYLDSSASSGVAP